ncbi:M23 family metallopeptidase [Streptomyces sp. NPDC017993]|uniref:M23 family metallopeptidase n=1 Tax=Streptomyces sp. NPDC017993 TaxID=3365027 RepID=UPI0037A36715
MQQHSSSTTVFQGSGASGAGGSGISSKRARSGAAGVHFRHFRPLPGAWPRPAAAVPPAPAGTTTRAKGCALTPEPIRYGSSCFFPSRAASAWAVVAVGAALIAAGPGPGRASATPTDRSAPPPTSTTVLATTTASATATATATARVAATGRPAERVREDDAPSTPEARAARAGDRAWPVDGPAGLRPTVVRGWEPPPSPWAAGHRGVDLSASAGVPVRAAAPGNVTFAGTVAGRGVLTIELPRSGHPPLRTTYEPVRATVRKGTRVRAGQAVAVLQRGPFHCRGPCLHWGLRRGKDYLNPLSLLPPSMLHGGHSRLLPIFGVPHPPSRADPTRSEEAAHTAETAGTPTKAALLAAVALTAAALWAIGRLSPYRFAGRNRDRGKSGGRSSGTIRRAAAPAPSAGV